MAVGQDFFKNFFLLFTPGGFGSSLRARWTSKTVVNCEFCTCPSQPSRHFVLGGRPKLWWNANFHVGVATRSSLRARRTPKTVVKCKILCVVAQPFRRFVLIGRPKLW